MFVAVAHVDVSAALVRDSNDLYYRSVITVTDFVECLIKCYSQQSDVVERAALLKSQLEDRLISEWLLTSNKPAHVVSYAGSGNLLEAAFLCTTHRIHRLPIIDTHEHQLLFIMNLSRLLRYTVDNENFPDDSDFLQYTVGQLPLGVFSDVVTVHREMPVIAVLTLLITHNLSAVPVTDEHGVLRNVFSKSDVRFLAEKSRYTNLDISVEEALLHRPLELLHTCTRESTIKSVVELLVATNVHRLYCVDNENRVEGVISVTDIFNLVLSKKATSGSFPKRYEHLHGSV
jgi:5'-AMP-activated protein kinase, regulatory gamma subunit